jgi:hypothetical protein
MFFWPKKLGSIRVQNRRFGNFLKILKILKMFKNTKCKKSLWKSYVTKQIIVFYIKTDLPFPKNVKNQGRDKYFFSSLLQIFFILVMKLIILFH